MTELEKKLQDLLNEATELTGEDFDMDYPDDAIDILTESDDEEWNDLAEKISDVLDEMEYPDDDEEDEDYDSWEPEDDEN